MRKRRFPAGQTIFHEGDLSDEAYILRAGRVEVLKDTPGGALRLAVLGTGDVLGEMGLLDERPRSATATVLEDVVADAVSRTEFMRLLVHEPHKSRELLSALFERLRTANRMLIESATASTPHSSLPHVKLIPLTPRTLAVLPAAGLEVPRFPFRIGRKPDSREAEALAFNEVQLADTPPFTLSLNHFALELGPGGVLVRDRGSQRGTLVNRTHIGVSGTRDWVALHAGENEVVAGPLIGGDERDAPFRFNVTVES